MRERSEREREGERAHARARASERASEREKRHGQKERVDGEMRRNEFRGLGFLSLRRAWRKCARMQPPQEPDQAGTGRPEGRGWEQGSVD